MSQYLPPSGEQQQHQRRAAAGRRDWLAYAEERLVSSLPPPATHSTQRQQQQRDNGGQTEFGVSKDMGVATIVTTADLGSLIPIPDDATLMRSTKESLLRCEEQATELLAYLQRELTLELQDAGVGFGPSLLDRLNHTAAIEHRKLRSDFQPRRQLGYHGGDDPGTTNRVHPSDEGGVSKEHWSYAAGHHRYSLYPTQAAVSARILGETRSMVEARHALFEDIDHSLLLQQRGES